MKRILSIVLCMAMLSSMVAMSVSAFGSYVDEVNEKSENVMTITTDKDVYMQGDTVVISAAMDSIWGDPDIVDDFEGYEGMEMPGAYGMMGINATVIYNPDVFTPKAAKSLLGSSTILNADMASFNATSVLDAKAAGSINAKITADPGLVNADGDAWGFLQGSGDLWTWNLQINADAPNGTYYLPVGPYMIYRGEAGTSSAVQFDEATDPQGREWHWLGQSSSYGNTTAGTKSEFDLNGGASAPTAVRFETGYTGGSRVVKGAEYECSYIKIVVGEDTTEADMAAAAQVDALIDAIGTVYAAGTVTKIDATNNNNLYTHISEVPGTSQLTVSFKMMPIADNDAFGYIGGTTDANGGSHNMFWNAAEKKFQIAKVNAWVNASEVTEVLAESEVMDLPENKWTDVEFIYDGSHMTIKVNKLVVCEVNNASAGYSFYIFYPSSASAYVADMKATWDGGSADFNLPDRGVNAAAYSYVTLDSTAAIAAAQEAYEALSASAKTYVTKKAVLDAAVAELAAIAEHEDTKYAAAAIAAIDAIGNVSYPASGTAIERAEALIATFTEAQLANVTNLETLYAARQTYDEKHVAFDKAKAESVMSMIDAIGEITFDSRAAIENAEAAYALLNEDQKAFVTNYQVLLDARAAYDMYLPIMDAENAINALATEFFQGEYLFSSFTSTTGYAQLPGVTDEFTFTTKFVYTAANVGNPAGDDSNIGLFTSDACFAGYDFTLGAFIIGKGGAFMSGSKTPEVIASTPYALEAGQPYTMTIEYKGAVASVYLDGELMVTANRVSTGTTYAIFYPMNADIYFESITANGAAMGQSDFVYGATMAGIDVIAPIDYVSRLAAAEAAVAALTDEQLALLADSYKEALAAAKADIEAKLALLQADADAVEALISAIVDDDSIYTALDAYQALTPGAQTLVENYADLEAAHAGVAIRAIDAIGEVTPDSDAAIKAAEGRYAELTDNEKALVNNYETLVAARKEINAQFAAIANAEAAINMLQAGGSAIVNNADPGVGAYSQYLDNGKNLEGGKANAEYAFSFDIYVDRITDPANGYFGGSSENEVFVGYDMIRKTVFVAKAGPWGYSSSIDAANIVAEVPFELELQKWYDFKFVMGDTTAYIYVDGELVLETAITEPSGWFIYYPKSIVSYYDNIEFWYNGEKQTSMSEFTKAEANNWTALGPVGDPGYYLTTTAPVGPVDKTDADLIAAARAAYEAVPAKAQYAVKNYAVLVEAETPDDPDADNKAAAAEIDALIAAIGDVTVDSGAAIVAAYEALAAADEAVLAFVENADALDAAIAAYSKALSYNLKVNGFDTFNVTVDASVAEQLTITWDAVDNAVKYWVFVDGMCPVTTTETSVTIDAKAGAHEIRIEAATDATPVLGGASRFVTAKSETVAVEVAAVVLPTIEATATATENSLTVEWNAIDGVAKYYVTIVVDGNKYIYKTAADVTSFTLAKHIAPESDYEVFVEAYIGETSYTVIKSETVAGVAPAKSFVILSTENGLIDWTDVEGAEKYWVAFTNAEGKTLTWKITAPAVSEFEVPAKLVAGDYTVAVSVLAGSVYDIIYTDITIG